MISPENLFIVGHVMIIILWARIYTTRACPLYYTYIYIYINVLLYSRELLCSANIIFRVDFLHYVLLYVCSYIMLARFDGHYNFIIITVRIEFTILYSYYTEWFIMQHHFLFILQLRIDLILFVFCDFRFKTLLWIRRQSSMF